MFALHDRVRRRICLTGFFLLCVVPTVLVVAWAVAWSSPWHVRAEARRIGRQLGMDISLGRVEHLRPGAVRLGDVVLRDTEDRKQVLRCRGLVAELKTASDKAGASRRVLTLRARTVQVDAERLPALGKLVRRVLELRAGNTDVELRCLAEVIELRSGESVERLSPARGAVQTFEGGSEAWLEFRVAGQPAGRPAIVRLGRNRHVEPRADWFVLNSRGATLPCAMLGRGIPAMGLLGRHARFRGCLHAELTNEGWQGELGSTGSEQAPCELLGVELDRLITDRFPHTLSGKAQVVIHRASFHGGRLKEIHGGVWSGPGRVSPSLLKAAVEHLGLAHGARLTRSGELVPYDWFVFRFAMNEDGLTVSGCGEGSKAVMVAGREWLLASTGRACPVVAVVRAMAPEGSVQVPATRQTEGVLRHLPLANVVPAGAVHGHSRIATDPRQEGSSE